MQSLLLNLTFFVVRQLFLCVSQIMEPPLFSPLRLSLSNGLNGTGIPNGFVVRPFSDASYFLGDGRLMRLVSALVTFSFGPQFEERRARGEVSARQREVGLTVTSQVAFVVSVKDEGV